MSEYQYYEFQAIDRPLTEEEQAEVAQLYRRVALTSRHAVFTYQFGDFPADPEEVLEQSFDAILYLANWGTRRLMFRFPKSLIDLKSVRPYEVEDVIEFRETKSHVIRDIDSNEEGGLFWVEGEGHLSSLARLRDDLLQQDDRLLYLAWLKAISLETLPESEIEPHIPPGLQSLSSALQDFIDLMEIDPHLVVVAAKESAKRTKPPERELEKAIGRLSREECDDYLRRYCKASHS